MIHVLSRAGFVVVVLLAAVGILSAVTRFNNTLTYLGDPAAFDARQMPEILREFDARYYAMPYLTLLHVTVGILFMVIGPLQFMSSIRTRHLGFHRWCGRVFLLASLVGVLSALAFVPMLPVFGSFSTRVGVVFASGVFLVSLVMGYASIRRRDIARHREWMIRLFAIGLGISTFRVLLPLLMLPPLSATFPEAWDAVVWLGFTINLLVAEVWINLTRPQGARRHVPAAQGVAALATAQPPRAGLAQEITNRTR
jgi:uncharacterized membrane protein